MADGGFWTDRQRLATPKAILESAHTNISTKWKTADLCFKASARGCTRRSTEICGTRTLSIGSAWRATNPIDLAQDAARNLVSTTPTTWPGTLAMLDYLPNMELLDGHLKIASASIGAALRSLAPA